VSEGVQKRKLIEVALPLEAINKEAAREKSIRHGHPSTLHLWWARRPLAAARAVLFAQLVDDPSAHPEEFPTEEEQEAERARLHDLIERLVVWENIRDESLLEEARQEILKSTGGNPPPILDPFAGGGTIPLEAQRLGLEAHASDLNPVAVLINKALIEIPPKFADQPPVFPGLAESKVGWKGAEGLAADVKAYGEWMRDEAEKRIGQHYPKAKLENGDEANVIAWIWARTVICPNPACGIEMPLVRSWWLGKKKGKEAYVVPEVVDDPGHQSGKKVEFRIGHDLRNAPTKDEDGTVDRNGARCVSCGTTCDLGYLRVEGQADRIGSLLLATVVEGMRRRIYLPPSSEQVEAGEVPAVEDLPDGEIADNPRWFSPPAYGMTTFSDLFTNRQLLALTTFSDLVKEAREKVLADAESTGMEKGSRLNEEGTKAEAYADAVATYLGLAVSRCTDYWGNICSWHSTRELIRNVFGRQAIPMVWDFAETMPFSSSAGNYLGQVDWVSKALNLAPARIGGQATQEDAVKAIGQGGFLISTDPPYYDNIGYSDLSDYFYVWLRRSLREVFPDILGTMLVPKAEELVANPYRHDGKQGAKEFFESGFYEVFAGARERAFDDYPITVYYAFKQSDSDSDGEASTGWETLLDGMIRGGWSITATWPMRSELGNRMLSQGTNALASSIVLSLRPRPDDAPTTDRRGFLSALEDELPGALRELQQGHIAPVDLPQAAIGPGMAVFSRYSRVVEADGSQMTVRSALARINEILDQVLNEQEGDFDPTTRFAIGWYRQHGYVTGKYGDANNLATARNTSVETMAQSGVLTSAAGKVTLIAPKDLPEDYSPELDDSIGAWEVLQHVVRLLNSEGIAAAGELLKRAGERTEGPVDSSLVKELGYLLARIAEQNSWTTDAIAFNEVVTTWPDIIAASRETGESQISQGTLDLEEE